MSSQEAAQGGRTTTPARDDAAPATSWAERPEQERLRSVADRVIAIANPKTTLDLGCGSGLLVQALAEKGVDAHGVDDDESALAAAHTEVRDRLEVRPWSRAVTGRHDLVTCLDVVERLDAREAQGLIDAVCAATDRVLFSSGPAGSGDPRHVNATPSQTWAAAFAEQGFYRRTDVDLALVGDDAVLFERADLQPRDVVHRYESALVPLTRELRDRREALRRLQREGANDEVVRLREQLRRAQHDVLTSRDHVIGLEAETDQLGKTVARLEQRLATQQTRLRKLRTRVANLERRARRAERKLEQVKVSRAWRLGRRLTRATTPEL